MKKSEIKDLYNNSESALKVIKAMYLLLPYAKDVDELALKIAAQVQVLFPVVKTMCDYMIDDGSYNMNERLQEIDRELRQIERDVAKMGYSKKRFILCQNCRAIINNIKDVDMWGKEPQQKPNEGAGGELAGCEPKTLSEPTGTATAGNDGQLIDNNDDQYIKLPLGMQTSDKRAEKIFKAAIDEKWMEAGENHGTWSGFDKTRDEKIKNYEQSLAYLCGQIYKVTDFDQPQIWGIIENYFQVSELSKHWGNVRYYEGKSGRKQPYQTKIDQLISQALKTP